MQQDAELRISRAPGLYNADGAQVPFSALPMTTAGIMNTRMQDAPPASRVDVESQLLNKFDVIGKSGLVAPCDRATLNDARGVTDPAPAARLPTADVFFRPITDRVSRACDDAPSFYRFDPDPSAAVKLGIPEQQRGGAATRMNAKDAYTDCKNDLPP